MKKTLSLVLSALLLLGLIASPRTFAAGVFKMQLSADKTKLAPGETLTVTVSVTENPGFLILTAIPSFDAAAFTQEGAVSYGSIGSGTKGKNAVIDAGSEDSTQTGTLFSFTLKVNEAAPAGSYTVGIKGLDGESPEVVNTAEEDVPASAAAVTVEVVSYGSNEATPAPASDETPGQEATANEPESTPAPSTPTVTVLAPEGELNTESVVLTKDDGTKIEVTEEDYSFEDGRLKLKEQFLETLGAGKYEISFQVDDTLVTDDFTLTGTAEKAPVQPWIIWTALAGVAAVVCAVAALLVKKKSPAKQDQDQ